MVTNGTIKKHGSEETNNLFISDKMLGGIPNEKNSTDGGGGGVVVNVAEGLLC
jgi:hypothetical protein